MASTNTLRSVPGYTDSEPRLWSSSSIPDRRFRRRSVQVIDWPHMLQLFPNGIVEASVYTFKRTPRACNLGRYYHMYRHVVICVLKGRIKVVMRWQDANGISLHSEITLTDRDHRSVLIPRGVWYVLWPTTPGSAVQILASAAQAPDQPDEHRRLPFGYVESTSAFKMLAR